MAYKKDVDDLRESPSLALIKILLEKGAKVAYNDPSATLNSTISDVSGTVSATAAAISNSATIDSRLGSLNSSQTNTAGVSAIATTTVRDVSGAVTNTAAAIGNSLTVTGF